MNIFNKIHNKFSGETYYYNPIAKKNKNVQEEKKSVKKFAMQHVVFKKENRKATMK